MTQYAMVIDLQKCVGCGACALACKTENNTALRKNGQTHNWADFIHETTGTFPNTKYRTLPVLCNHCSDAPCVEACPVEPKAMFKTAEGVTMHSVERCIGCRSCQDACPYSMEEVEKDGSAGEYSVISYNEEDEPSHNYFTDNTQLIKNCTTTGTELASLAGVNPPYAHRYTVHDCEDIRRDNVVEKCLLCDQRRAIGKQPYCVDSCPSGARVVGDIHDPNSRAYKLLRKYKSFVLQEDEGTQPNVYYTRNYKV